MILGYLLTAIAAGLVAFLLALLSGTSFLLSVGIYTLVGTLTIILLPLTQFLIGRLIEQFKTQEPLDRRTKKHDTAFVDTQLDRT